VYGSVVVGQSLWRGQRLIRPIGCTPTLWHEQRRCSCGMRPVALYKCYIPLPYFRDPRIRFRGVHPPTWWCNVPSPFPFRSLPFLPPFSGVRGIIHLNVVELKMIVQCRWAFCPSPNFFIFVQPEDFRDAFCVAEGATGRPWVVPCQYFGVVCNTRWILWRVYRQLSSATFVNIAVRQLHTNTHTHTHTHLESWFSQVHIRFISISACSAITILCCMLVNWWYKCKLQGTFKIMWLSSNFTDIVVRINWT